MLIICPNCFAKFDVNDRLLKKNIQKFACSNCGERFEENLQALRADETEPFNLKSANMLADTADKAFTTDEALGNEGHELFNQARQDTAISTNEDLALQPEAKFTWSNDMEEDLSVQSLPEEFVPVPEKKKKKGGLGFVLVFLLIVAGILAFAWYKRADLMTHFPNVQKGLHLIMGKPYATLPTTQITTAASLKEDESSQVVQPRADIMHVQEENESEPQNPTDQMMAQSTAERVENNENDTPVTNGLSIQPVRKGINDISAGFVSQEGAGNISEEVVLQEIDLNAVPEALDNNHSARSDMNANSTAAQNNDNLEQPTHLGTQQFERPTVINESGKNGTTTSNVIQNAPSTLMGTTLSQNGSTIIAPVVPSDEQIVLEEILVPIIEESKTIANPVSNIKGVQVKDVIFRYDTSLSSHPRLYVQGLVTNLTTQTITMPALKVEMYDKDEKVLGTQTIPSTSSKLGPNMAEFFFREIEPLPQGLVRRVNITVKETNE